MIKMIVVEDLVLSSVILLLTIFIGLQVYIIFKLRKFYNKSRSRNIKEVIIKKEEHKKVKVNLSDKELVNKIVQAVDRKINPFLNIYVLMTEHFEIIVPKSEFTKYKIGDKIQVSNIVSEKFLSNDLKYFNINRIKS